MEDEVIIKCPVCHDHPTHNHLYISLTKGVYHCWLCEAKGRLDNLIRRYPSVKTKIKAADLAFALSRMKERRWSREIPIFTPLAKARFPHAGACLRYLRRRGLTDEEIVKYKVMISPNTPNRAIFPHPQGPDRFWAGRAFYKNVSPPWLFPKRGQTRLSKGEVVWGIEDVRRRGEKDIWICEGIFDAIACNGVAVFGKSPSPKQLRTIIELEPRRLIVAFDADAEKDARALQELTRSVIPTQVRLPEKAVDYGEYMRFGYRRLPHSDRWERIDD